MVATDAQLATDQAYLTIDMCSNGRAPQSTSDDNHGSDGPVPRTSSTIARDSVLLQEQQQKANGYGRLARGYATYRTDLPEASRGWVRVRSHVHPSKADQGRYFQYLPHAQTRGHGKVYRWRVTVPNRVFGIIDGTSYRVQRTCMRQ